MPTSGTRATTSRHSSAARPPSTRTVSQTRRFRWLICSPALQDDRRAKIKYNHSVKTNLSSKATPRPGYGPLPTAQMNRRLSHLSTARATILVALIDQPEPCTVAALSAQIGQHPNTIREHLDGLVSGGLVVRTQAVAQGRGRHAWLYSAARAVGSDPESREYAALASALAAQIGRISAQPGADAIEAGRRWGRELVRGSQPGQGEGSVQ